MQSMPLQLDKYDRNTKTLCLVLFLMSVACSHNKIKQRLRWQSDSSTRKCPTCTLSFLCRVTSIWAELAQGVLSYWLSYQEVGVEWETALNFNHSSNNIFEINNMGPKPLAFQRNWVSLWMLWRWWCTCSFLLYLSGFKRSMPSHFQGKYLLWLLAS